MGIIYLLHFDRPYRHARHYLGYTSKRKPDARLQAHRDGTGARLMAVLKQAGIGFVLARTWKGDRALERALKKRKCAPKLCPICNAKE